MDKDVLVRDDRHEGKYIAFLSVVDHTVVAEGDDPESVVRDAKKAGYEHPMVIYVPDKDTTYCY